MVMESSRPAAILDTASVRSLRGAVDANKLTGCSWSPTVTVASWLKCKYSGHAVSIPLFLIARRSQLVTPICPRYDVRVMVVKPSNLPVPSFGLGSGKNIRQKDNLCATWPVRATRKAPSPSQSRVDASTRAAAVYYWPAIRRVHSITSLDPLRAPVVTP